MIRWIWGIAVILGLAAGAQAGVITVDGDLSDWNLFVGDGNTSHINDYDTGAWTAPAWVLGYHLEDTNDGSNSYAVGPGWGGQNYDAEFVGVGYDDATGRLLVAIVSGQRPDNGPTLFGPGDIRIETGLHTFGIEVGGAGLVDPSGMTLLGNAGATYNVNSSGYTMSVDTTPPGDHLAGTAWMDPIWIATGPYVGLKQAQLSGGTHVGDADAYVFTRNEVGLDHSIIELSIDVSMFMEPGQDTVMLNSITWMPSCGNDVLQVSLDTPFTPQSVPLPRGAVLGFAGLGFLGLLAGRRRSRARRALA